MKKAEHYRGVLSFRIKKLYLEKINMGSEITQRVLLIFKNPHLSVWTEAVLLWVLLWSFPKKEVPYYSKLKWFSLYNKGLFVWVSYIKNKKWKLPILFFFLSLKIKYSNGWSFFYTIWLLLGVTCLLLDHVLTSVVLPTPTHYVLLVVYSLGKLWSFKLELRLLDEQADGTITAYYFHL